MITVIVIAAVLKILLYRLDIGLFSVSAGAYNKKIIVQSRNIEVQSGILKGDAAEKVV